MGFELYVVNWFLRIRFFYLTLKIRTRNLKNSCRRNGPFKSWKLGLGGLNFFNFQLFFTNKTFLTNKWMSFSSTDSALEILTYVQGISYWSVKSNSARRGRSINHFIDSWFIVGSGGLEIWVSSTSFQKSNIDWPQQPLTEKVLVFNLIFHDSTPKHYFFKTSKQSWIQ